MAVRRALHSMGFRYRIHTRPIRTLRRTADIVFTRSKVAVMIDGCYWHGCPVHGTSPKNNAGWWSEKLARNAARDRETDALLVNAGWTVCRIWEHEDPVDAAQRVAAVVAQRR